MKKPQTVTVANLWPRFFFNRNKLRPFHMLNWVLRDFFTAGRRKVSIFSPCGFHEGMLLVCFLVIQRFQQCGRSLFATIKKLATSESRCESFSHQIQVFFFLLLLQSFIPGSVEADLQQSFRASDWEISWKCFTFPVKIFIRCSF